MKIIQLHLFLIGAAIMTYFQPFMEARTDSELRFIYEEYNLDPSVEEEFNKAVDLTITSDSPFKSFQELVTYDREAKLSTEEFAELREYYYEHRSKAQVIRDKIALVDAASKFVLFAMGMTLLGVIFFLIGVIKKFLRLWAKI